MLGIYGGEDLDVIFNTVIFISKWEIWKIRNKVKYNQSRIGDQTIFNTWKNNFKKHLQYTLQTSHIDENDKKKLELFGITYEYLLFMNIKLMHGNNCIV